MDATRFQGLIDAARAVLVEREQVIQTAVVALLARANHLQLGPPGTGKSYLATTMTQLISGSIYYETLITGQSLEEQLYGPISMKGLEEDRYRRNTEGYLPTADIAFVDEWYRGSGPILNANLWILNERKFHNDGMVFDIPLISLLAAANDAPTDPDLAAIHDRMDFKHIVTPVLTEKAFTKMIRLSIERPKIEPVITVEELREAHVLVDQIEVSKECITSLTEIWKELASEKIHPSDRKFTNAIRMARACAFLAGRQEARPEDLAILQHVLWNDATEISIVTKTVLSKTNPLDRQAAAVQEHLAALSPQIEDAIKSDSHAVRVSKSLALITKLEIAGSEIAAVQESATAAGMSEPVRLVAAVRSLNSFSRKLITRGFSFEGDPGTITRADIEKIVKRTQGGDA